jgi:hypothetical protein
MELAKKKADKLVDKYIQNWNLKLSIEDAKECAAIAVENEIKDIMWLNLLCTFDNPMKEHLNSKIEYLKDVKQEINNL